MAIPIKTRFYGVFSFRVKQNVDSLLLAFIPLSFFVSSQVFGFLLGIFACIGIWLIFGRHKCLRFGDSWIGWTSVALSIYGVLHVGLNAIAQDDWAFLCIPFPAFLILTIPFAVGIVLVHKPLQTIVMGCRLAIIILSLIAAYNLAFLPEGRAGFGTNPVIAAYIILIASCISRFPLTLKSPSWHGQVFFYLGVLGAISTGTRILLLFFVIAFALDAMRVIYHYFRATIDTAQFRLLIATLCLALPMVIFFGDWFRIDYVANSSINRLLGDQSIQTRFHLWAFGWQTFTANPIFGLGQCNLYAPVQEFLLQEMGLNLTFKHLHNFVVHELAVYGLIGFALVMAFHIVLYTRLYRLFPSSEQRWAFNLFFVGLAVYGLTGTYLSDERMVALTALMFGVFIAEGKKYALNLRLKDNVNKDDAPSPKTPS